ncbi:plexin-B1-like [Diadema setosum]|uniref:plexin-B1-like n=1 Tax=Diadema setosum TaxID=31175 RepID=UPI003B3BBED6
MGNRGQEFCPQLLGVQEEILVPVGVNTAYTLLAKHLPTDQRKYAYNEELLLKSVRVSVRWNGNNNIDDVTGSQVTLYKCSVNTESCSRCLSPEVTPARLGCGWCGTDCNVAGSEVCLANGFLNQNMYLRCNGPVITSIFPASGPPEGNTRLEIRGKDLGLTFSHITKISIGDFDCDLTNMEIFYDPGLSVSCVTAPHERISAEQIQIVVTLGDGERTAYFEDPFYFRDPRVTRFNPTKGPAAGGTRITIYGEFLNTGRNITARLGNSECSDVTYEGSEARCTTTAVSEGAQSLIMTFDGADRFSPDAFTVLPNPVVTSVDRGETIMSGGLQMHITGERFDIIQESRIISQSLSSGAIRTEVCVIVSPTLLVCPTPPYPDGQSHRRMTRESDARVANITFDLDGFVINGGIITYHPDPVYFDIAESDRTAIITDNKRLDLEGQYLDTVSNKEDVQVLIGLDGVCDVLILEFDSLICLVPIPLPGAGDYNGSLGEGPKKSLPAVVVQHGNLEFRPGFVKTHSESNILPVVISITVIAILVLLAVGVVPDTKLELTDVDDRVQKYGIPFRDHNQYVTVMLFGGLGVRPETSDPEYMEDFMEQAIVSFYRSLKDEESAVAFIQTFEMQRQYEQSTRQLIASLLSLIYVSEGKSIYFSESESIVDKLVANWFALCMCGYSKQMLYPMFMLYQALKSQCEKGPVDAVTGEAYFTLDYNRLFDQDITFQEVVLFVVDEDDNAFLKVKVLDVDTVGQAKQKILDSMWKAGHRLLPTDGESLDVDESLTPDQTSPPPGLSTQKPSNLGATHLKETRQLRTDDTNTPVHVTQGRAGLGRDLAIAHMLTTKAAVSPYVTNVLESMFKFPQKYPLPIKHLFDTFDELAREYAVGGNTNVAERWKRNCLTQFWVGLLARIPYLFNMPRSDPADQCLNVLVDAIYHALKDEPPPETSKQQPYFGDYALQSRMVTTFCKGVSGLPKEFRGHFSHHAALLQLFNLTKHDLQDML